MECMQVDASEANEVLTAPCQGRASEEWTAIGEGNGNVEFKNHDDGLCLNTKNDSFHLLNAATAPGRRSPSRRPGVPDRCSGAG